MIDEKGYCSNCAKMVSVTISGECKECGEPLDMAWDLDDHLEED